SIILIKSLNVFIYKQKTAYEIETDWSSDVCSSDLFERDDAKELTEPFIALEQRSEPEDRDRRPVVGVGSLGELGASLGDDVVDPAFDARELLVENIDRGRHVRGRRGRTSPHRPAVRGDRPLLLRRSHRAPPSVG